MSNLTFEQRTQCDEQGHPSSARVWAFRILYAGFAVLLVGQIASFFNLKTAADYSQYCVGILLGSSVLSILFGQIKSGYVLGKEASTKVKVEVETTTEATEETTEEGP